MIKDTAKTILCYGDSNTWGSIPRSNSRYPRSVRWPSVLQSLLGDEYEVVSEGLPGRTFVAVEPGKAHRTGITHLQALVESADPVDTVIIMLGTNDIKSTFNLAPQEIANHLEQTVQSLRSGAFDIETLPRILIICPPPVIRPAAVAKSGQGQELDARMVRGLELFKALPALYKGIADTYGCDFIDAGEHITSSSIDGYHFDAESHIKLAGVIQAKLQLL